MSKRPKPSSRHVSAQMRRMPSRDTKPELALRSELHQRGLRYRVHVAALPGRPDIVLRRARVAVFVDGCFWHGCPDHGVLPKSNQDWWRTKLDRNVERDRENDAHLEELGWLSIHVWEHENVSEAADVIETLWRRRTGRA